jgi:methyl-accepting chemotaxis protein
MHNGNEMAACSSDLGSEAAKAVLSIEEQAAIASSRIEQIAVAAEQLTTTIKDMSLHMDQIAQNIGANSSATDKIADTATELNQQAERLQRKTTQFKIVA